HLSPKQMLAADTITIEIAGEAIELRPTLLAATRLARRYRDFATLYRHILADHATAHHDVIREASGSTEAADTCLTMCDVHGLRETCRTIKLAMLKYVLALAGDDGDSRPVKQSSGRSMPFDEYHAELFSIGTGWLGWTTAATW